MWLWSVFPFMGNTCLWASTSAWLRYILATLFAIIELLIVSPWFFSSLSYLWIMSLGIYRAVDTLVFPPLSIAYHRSSLGLTCISIREICASRNLEIYAFVGSYVFVILKLESCKLAWRKDTIPGLLLTQPHSCVGLVRVCVPVGVDIECHLDFFCAKRRSGSLHVICNRWSYLGTLEPFRQLRQQEISS